MSNDGSDFFDMNSAGKQRDLLPSGIYDLYGTVRLPTGNNDDDPLSRDINWLRKSKDGLSKQLDLEYIVQNPGPYHKQKMWDLLTVDGTSEGHRQAMEISRRRIRAMIECSRGIRPDDDSEEARNKRRIKDWGDLNGIYIIAKVGIQKGKDDYPDKNVIQQILTPDKSGWHPTVSGPSGGAAPSGVVPMPIKPKWA